MAGGLTPTEAGGWSRLLAPERWVASGLLIVALGSSANAEAPALPSLLKRLDLRAYTPGTTAPALSGTTLDDRQLSFIELHGKVVILNFWASWCPECRTEMPALERIHREFASQGLVVIGMNTREDRETVRRYAKDAGLTFPIVLDPDGAIDAVYGVVALPTTFIIGRDGRAVALAIGPREWASVPARAIIQTLLAEPAPRPVAR